MKNIMKIFYPSNVNELISLIIIYCGVINFDDKKLKRVKNTLSAVANGCYLRLFNSDEATNRVNKKYPDLNRSNSVYLRSDVVLDMITEYSEEDEKIKNLIGDEIYNKIKSLITDEEIKEKFKNSITL